MLIAEDISFKVRDKVILQHVGFEVLPGEHMAILGSNGAGKSTLLKVLCGELNSCTGLVKMQGKLLQHWSAADLARFRAVLQQHTALTMPFLVKDVVMMGRYPHQKERSAQLDDNIVASALHKTGIEHLAERNYLQLSGGEQQRVHLARIFAQIWHSADYDVRYLFMDEPINSLDIRHQHNALELAREFAAEGNCVISVLHDLNLAAQYADKILLMKQGKVLAFGTPAQVLDPQIISKAYDYNLWVCYPEGHKHPVVIPMV